MRWPVITAGQNKSSEQKIALQYACAPARPVVLKSRQIFDDAGIHHWTVQGYWVSSYISTIQSCMRFVDKHTCHLIYIHSLKSVHFVILLTGTFWSILFFLQKLLSEQNPSSTDQAVTKEEKTLWTHRGTFNVSITPRHKWGFTLPDLVAMHGPLWNTHGVLKSFHALNAD